MRIIVAIDNQRGMAQDDGIPWTLPTDQKFFQDQIAEGLILMGYGTYAEVTQPLHQRVNYVATRKDEQLRPGFEKVADAQSFLDDHSADLVQNIGGAGLFAATLDRADELVITRVQGAFDCSKFFPPFEDRFTLVDESEPVTENGSTFTFQTWHPRR